MPGVSGHPEWGSLDQVFGGKFRQQMLQSVYKSGNTVKLLDGEFSNLSSGKWPSSLRNDLTM
jgi:hypothetical protein